MPHAQFVADDEFPPAAIRKSLRGKSVLEVRTTTQSAMGRLLEWFRPGLVAVLDLTRETPRCPPADAVAAYSEGSFDAVFGFGALRSRRMLDALAPADLVRTIRPGGYLLLSDFAPGSGELWRNGALVPSTAPLLMEWFHRFGGVGMSWMREHRAFADAGRLIVARASRATFPSENVS
jgi:hypothetical protein